MSDIDQAALLEILAGKNRANTAMAILSNTKDLEEAYVSALEAEGSALQENEKYLDSIQGKIDLFNNALQTMWSNTLDSDTIKGFVTLGTKILEIADNIGVVKLALAGLITYISSKYFNIDFGKIFSGFTARGINTLFGKEMISGVQTAQTHINQLKSSIEAAKQAYMDNPTEANKAALANAEESLVMYEKLHAEGYKVSNNKLGYFGSEIQKIKDYKSELKSLDSAIPEAEQKLQAAKEELDFAWSQGEFGDVSADEIDQYSENVKEAQVEVDTLKKKQAELEQSGAGAFSSLANGVSKLAQQIQSAISSMLVMYAISKVMQGIEYVIDSIFETYEEAHQSFEDLNSELTETKSQIKDLESQLKDINKQIEDIQSATPLTFTDHEELSRLKAQSAELQRQLDLTNALQQQQQKGVNESAIQAANKYAKTGVKTGKTTGENVGSKAGTGAGVGAAVGVASGVGTAILGTKAGAALGAWAGPVGMLIGAVVGALGGAIVGAVVGGIQSASEERVGDSLDNMKEQYEKLQSEYNKARTKYQDDPTEKTKKKFEEAQKELATYESNMATYLSEMDAYYSSIDLSVYDPDKDAETIATLRKEIDDFYDTQDKWAIQSGGTNAKTNAIARIFGEHASDDIKSLKSDIEEAMTAARDAGVAPDFDFQAAFDSANLEEFKQRLYDIGLTVTDVKYYFLDLAKAEEAAEDAYSTYDTVKQINTLQDGVQSLKDAFGEFAEEGYISTQTLVELEETFGNLGSAWETFIDKVATGSGSLQAATKAVNELLEAYLSDKLSSGALDIEEKFNTIILLSKLGVKNAKEYVDAMQKSQMVQEIAANIIADKDGGKTQEEHIQQIEDKYKIDLNEEEERLLIEKAITAEKTKQAATDATNAQSAYEEAVYNKELAEDKLKKAKEDYQEFYSFDWKYNGNRNNIGYVNQVTGEELTIEEYGDRGAALKAAVEDAQEAVDAIEIPTKVDASNAVEEAERAEKEYQDALNGVGLTIDAQLTDFSDELDKIQDAYSTLNSVVTEYNESGFLTLDNLQALLSLEPEYLACLQMENGQLSINQVALEQMVQARLAEAKATVVQSAMEQLHALAARTEEDAVKDSAAAAANAISGLGAYASALGTVAQDAIVAAGAVSAFNAAVEGAQSNEFVDQSEIDTILSNMNTQLEMIDSVSANLATNFNAITGVDGTTGGGGTNGDTALERIQNKYEGLISNLENKQTYLQNKIDLLEAENEAVSKSYYEEQIALEQEKLNLYTKEGGMLDELKALYAANPTQETADAIWEIEHAIQESTLRMVEFRKSIIDLYDEAFNDIAQAYDNKDDALEDQQNYIDKYQQLMELQGSPEAATGYNKLIQTEEAQLANNIAKLDALIAARDAAYANSDIEELSDEQWIAMEDEIRAVEAAILDNKIALEEYNQELKNLYVEAFNSVRGAFGFKDEFYSNQQSYIEGYADYLEAIGVDAPQELYDTLIEIEQKKRENTLADLVDARAGLADLEAQGFTAADEEWQDAYGKIVELEKKIQDSDIAMAQWEKTLRDMDFEKFERFISRLDDINSEIEHIQNLLADEDVAFEDGTWTEEGITSLGLLYQQMQLAQQKSKEYAEEIDELNATYAEGVMSEQEYYERLQELKEGQWDAIETYEDAKDAIVDMEEARIDMIEEGINEEIEAYQELIDLKREELDAERDLYEFKKNIQKQTKDIATLERRIAAMSGSTDAATIAERTKLEAELRQAQEGLDDTYYTHAKDMQNQALDDEATSYQEAKEDYLETLRDALDDTAAIIEAKISEFLLNADVGLQELNGISQEHGITLSDALMLPWQNASEISSAFKLTADENLWSLINEDGIVTIFSNEAKLMLGDVFSSAGDAAQLFNSDVETVVGNIKTIVENSTSPLTANLSFPWEDTASADGPISTFSTAVESAINSVINKAKTDYQTIKTYLSQPFTAAGDAVNTFASNTITKLNAVIKKAEETAAAISKADNTKTPDYVGSSNSDGGGGDDGGSNSTITPSGTHSGRITTPSTDDVKALQTCLNMIFSSGLKVDGKLGPATTSALKAAQKKMYYAGNETMKSQDGLYGAATRAAMVGYINKKIESMRSQGGSSMIGQGIRQYESAKKMLPKAFYAKGTLGTKQDQWAITDEPQYGDELVLIPNAAGNLSYMRKGTSVVPADITKNLMEWGQLNPNMDMSSAVQGINVMTNVVNKPETNLSFENLLHIDNCTKEVLPEVKKIITEQLESFTKKLNYNLKRVGSTT